MSKLVEIFIFSAFLAIASPAIAYVGPGAGLGAIAAAVAVLVGVILLIVGFIYFPVKRMLKLRKAKSAEQSAAENSEATEGR